MTRQGEDVWRRVRLAPGTEARTHQPHPARDSDSAAAARTPAAMCVYVSTYDVHGRYITWRRRTGFAAFKSLHKSLHITISLIVSSQAVQSTKTSSPVTKNGRTPSAKREDAISNSEVHLSKIGPASGVKKI